MVLTAEPFHFQRPKVWAPQKTHLHLPAGSEGPTGMRKQRSTFHAPWHGRGGGVRLITTTADSADAKGERPQLVAGVRRGRHITVPSWALGPCLIEARVYPRRDESAARPSGTAAVCLWLKEARRHLFTSFGRPCGRQGGRSEISTKNLVFSLIHLKMKFKNDNRLSNVLWSRILTL